MSGDTAFNDDLDARVWVDDIGVKVLKELSRDARASYREIARRTNLAVGAVASRIAALEKAGVIKGYGVVLDTEKMVMTPS